MAEQLYMVQIEELDTYTSSRKRYYMKNASDVRRVATMPAHIARHVVANMGNDFRYLRHATMVAVDNRTPEEIALERELNCAQVFYL